jgi:DNA polymerase I
MLLDGHSLAYRAFYALPVENFSTTSGQPTNAVYGFTSMLINSLRDEKPTHVAVAFDVSRATFRTEQYPEYKANRTSSPDAFKGQVSLIEDVLEALRVAVLAVDGYEADDVIATLSQQAVSDGMDVAIITGDRDAFQLINEHVTVLYPKKGVSELARMTPDAVVEKYGLSPEQYPDFAALRGDPSDNLPGIPGVGEKTATKWIREYGSFTGLVERADEVKGKVGDALRQHLGQVMTNRQLTELVRDVPLSMSPNDLERRDWDRDAVHEIFDALQFRVLRERLAQTIETSDDGATTAPDVEVDLLAAGEMAPWLATHVYRDGDHAHCGLAVDGTWGRGGGALNAVALAADDGSVVALSLASASPEDVSAFGAWSADPDCPKAIHDANGPMLALRSMGHDLRGVDCDTALAAYLLRPDQRNYELGDLAVRWLHRDLDGVSDDGQLTLGAEPDAELGQTLGTRALATRDLAQALTDELAEFGGDELLRDVELPLTAVLVGMQRAGIGVDIEHLASLHEWFSSEAKSAAEAAYAEIGHEVNLGSPKQLQVVLFEELNMPKTKRTKTGWTTDADALTALYAQTEHPFLAQLLRHRDVTKLLVTVEGLQRATNEDQRIHTTLMQTVAATGRLSSTEPNLQNIPVRTDEGRRIRAAFSVGPGYEALMTADYSQVEMRIMAHLSDDEALMEAFRSGEDLHTTVGSYVFDVPAGEVTAQMRSRIKAMSYGLAYGLSAFGLAQQLGVSADEARGLMDEYFKRFGGVRDYLASVVAQARLSGYTETVLGRRRYLPDLASDNRQRREMAERMALNAPIQGSAADIVKLAMLGVDRALRESQLSSRMLLQVHDELVLEVSSGEREPVERLVREQMGNAFPLNVPLDVTVGFGRTWQDAAH